MADESTFDKLMIGLDEAEDNWFESWFEEDFSWAGLSEDVRQALLKVTGVQEANVLEAKKFILQCGTFGKYHIWYIPTKWAYEIEDFELSEQELIAKKREYFDQIKQQPTSLIEQLLRGSHIPPGINESAVVNTAANCFEFITFESSIRTDFRSASVDFLMCKFDYRHIIYSHQDSNKIYPADHKLYFGSCIFKHGLNIDKSKIHTGALELQNCHSNFGISIINSTLDTLKIASFKGGKVTVSDSEINGVFRILNCNINDIYLIEGSVFSDVFHLSHSRIERRLCINECDFKSRFHVEGCLWPDVEAEGQSSASQSVFNEPCTLSAIQGDGGEYVVKTTIPIQFFSEADFRSDVLLDGALSETDWDKQFRKEIEVKQEITPENPYPEASLEILGDGCRKLAALAQKRGDEHQHFFWNRNSLKVRLERKVGSKWERIFSKLYSVTSDFGYSIHRPLSWLIFAFLLMGIVYSLMATGVNFESKIDWNIWAAGTSFSASRTVPFGIFEAYLDEGIRSKIVGELPADGWTALLKRAVLYLHTAFSLVLLYIFVMTVRRKFLMK